MDFQALQDMLQTYSTYKLVRRSFGVHIMKFISLHPDWVKFPPSHQVCMRKYSANFHLPRNYLNAVLNYQVEKISLLQRVLIHHLHYFPEFSKNDRNCLSSF